MPMMVVQSLPCFRSQLLNLFSRPCTCPQGHLNCWVVFVLRAQVTGDCPQPFHNIVECGTEEVTHVQDTDWNNDDRLGHDGLLFALVML